MNGVVYLTASLVAAAFSITVLLYWVASRKRIAAETVGRADEQSRTLLRDA
jgi:hypothetical protein